MIHHTVVKGDNLWDLDAFYGLPSGSIARANRVNDADLIYVGAVLHIPTTPPQPEPDPAGLTVNDMAYGMFGAPYRDDGRFKDGVLLGVEPWGQHEQAPARANDVWDWFDGARWGAEAPWSDWVIPWGQLFPTETNTVWDVRFQVRDVHLMVLDAGGVWRDVAGDVRGSRMNGEFWDTSFRGQGSDSYEQIRDESGNGGGWSVRLGAMRDRPNYATWHWFYPDGFYPRPPVPAGTRAILSACQMRLIGDGQDPDGAGFVASFGADNWPAQTGGKPDGKQITPFYQPRLQQVDAEWRWFSGHTFADWFTDGKPDPARMGPEQIMADHPTIKGAL